jgi:glucokinase
MFLGIEIGGTKLQLGLGRGDGRLAALWRGAIDVHVGAEGIRRQILGAVPEIIARAGPGQSHLGGIGIGFGGPVDDTTRSIIRSHQIAGWDSFPIVDWIRERLGVPAVLGNDADVAGLAEALFGAGRGLSPIFYITIGSGIGGGLIIDGTIQRGVGRGAAEIGHLRFVYRGKRLPLEEIASGWGIEERARATGLSGTAKEIGELAAAGHPVAKQVLEEGWEYLAEAVCHVIALVCPRRIVIGGGVSLTGEEVLFKPLRRLVSERVFAPFAGLTGIVPAALGEEVVVHGALALARQHFGD